MGHTRYKHDVAEYLTKRPGMLIYASEIAEAVDITAKQVAQAVSTLRRENERFGLTIRVEIPAQAWTYLPNRPAVVTLEPVKVESNPEKPKETMSMVNRPRTFKAIGKSGSGHILVEDHMGVIFKLVEV